MKKIITILLIAFFLIQSHTAVAFFSEKNISIGLKNNNLTTGETLSVLLNPSSPFAVPFFLQIAIVDQSFSVVHQQTILFSKATEYRWNLPFELKNGIYLATVSVDNGAATETVGLPFTCGRKTVKIKKSQVLLPVQEDTVFYGFSLFFKTNLKPGSPVYYTLRTKDSVSRRGFSQVDSTGLIEVGGNNFYEKSEVVFSLLDTCRTCFIEPYSIATNPMNREYFTSIFNGLDSNMRYKNKTIDATASAGNLPSVVVKTTVKTRKELYEARYVSNFMLKSPMSREVVVDDDPYAINYNNNLPMYLLKVFPGLSLRDNTLMFRMGTVAMLVDEFPFREPPPFMSDIAYIKFLPEPPRGLNETPGFFSSSKGFAGITATVVVYTKKHYEDTFIPKKTISLAVQGALNAAE